MALSIRSALKVLSIIYLLSSYKSLPFAYLIRFYYQVFTKLLVPNVKRKLGFKIPIGPKINDEGINLAVFTPVPFKTYTSPLECDMYLHKSNSTYFVELDLARTKCMLTIFNKYFDDFYNKTKNFPYVPVASVQATFKKEIKPYARYDVTTRILAWDDKWLFLISKFTLPGQKDRTSCTSITKYVIKDGRKTVKPSDVMEQCGLYNEGVEAINAKNFELVKEFVNTGVVQDIDMNLAEAKAI